jgi:serine O-acetyltransferase
MTRQELKRLYRSMRPGFVYAVIEDVDAFCANRNEDRPASRGGRILAAARLCWQSDAFLAVLLYRLRTALYGADIPILPRLLHFLSIRFGGVNIGDWTVMQEGIYMPHGQVVVDGLVQIGRRCILSPWVTIGRQEGVVNSPTLEESVFVGTGAKILGGVTVGAHAKIGANAVVVRNVPVGATAVGVPARLLDANESTAE